MRCAVTLTSYHFIAPSTRCDPALRWCRSEVVDELYSGKFMRISAKYMRGSEKFSKERTLLVSLSYVNMR
jgi:hypothetical protein